MLQVTESNYAVVAEGLSALRQDRALLEREMRRYPLIIELAGYRWCLGLPVELEELITKLAAKLGAFRVQQQRRAA